MIFCLMSKSAFTQVCNPYFPLQKGNYWAYGGQSGEFPRITYLNVHIYVLNDTIIKGKSYSILNYVEDSVITRKYYRSDANNDLFYFSKEDNAEYLLYKFSGFLGESYYSNKEYFRICYKINEAIIFEIGNTSSAKTITFYRSTGLYSISGQNYWLGLDIDNFKVLNNCETNRIEQNKTQEISCFQLTNNYPNPFNPETKISYSIPKTGNVKLKIYDLLGRDVKTLFSGNQTMGTYITTFNAYGLSSGLYFVELIFNSQDSKITTKLYNKMIFTK